MSLPDDTFRKILELFENKIIENTRLRASIGAIHYRLSCGNIDDAAVKTLIGECEFVLPELKEIPHASL